VWIESGVVLPYTYCPLKYWLWLSLSWEPTVLLTVVP
jgi:hypothetical protein